MHVTSKVCSLYPVNRRYRLNFESHVVSQSRAMHMDVVLEANPYHFHETAEDIRLEDWTL